MKKFLMFFVAVAFVVLLNGCAGITFKDKYNNVIRKIEAYGALRTVTAKEEYENGVLDKVVETIAKDGVKTITKYYIHNVLKSSTISTDSNTKDVLMGLNQIIDSGINTFSKLKP